MIWQNKSIQSVNVIYFNGPSFTSIQQGTTNAGIVCICPLVFSEMPLFVSTGSELGKLFQAPLTLSIFVSKQLTDRWNHLNKGRSLYYKLIISNLLDHLGKLSWCRWYRHYTSKIDLPLTFLWFSSISCKPSGYSFGKRLS